MYHQVMVYDHIIAYSQLAFFVIDMEAMINFLAARKLWHTKSYFNIMSRTVHTSGCNILYFIVLHSAFIMLSVFSIYYAVVSSATPQEC